MDLNCPKCNSEQTQKITAIVNDGTTHSRGTTVSTGIGSVGGRMAVGSSVGTTNTTSTTSLARKLAAPEKLKEGYILQLILVMVFLGWVPAALVGNFMGTFMGVVTYAGVGYLLFQKMRNTAIQNREYNATVYPGARHQWENGFYCHRCEHVFVPQR